MYEPRQRAAFIIPVKSMSFKSFDYRRHRACTIARLVELYNTYTTIVRQIERFLGVFRHIPDILLTQTWYLLFVVCWHFQYIRNPRFISSLLYIPCLCVPFYFCIFFFLFFFIYRQRYCIVVIYNHLDMVHLCVKTQSVFLHEWNWLCQQHTH